MLHADDFASFFKEIHGVAPFPWQRRLSRHLSETGSWPATLDLPTGTGKTAAIDIAVFHLALEAVRGERRRAPVRIAFVVDRRLVVDDAHARALKLQRILHEPSGPATAAVAEALKTLSLDGPPLIARRLRGGLPREGDWARTPSQPTVLCSTVDQIGSRLLFRGYGVSDSMKPVHAGLIGSDCLILLDEAHLAEPFRQTLAWVQRYRSDEWRESKQAAPWGVAQLTATPGQADQRGFALDEDDCRHPVLQRRLQVRKRALLRLVDDEASRQQAFVSEVHEALACGARAVAVVVNQVVRARDVFSLLQAAGLPEPVDLLLLIGPARPVEREHLAQSLAPIRTGAPRDLDKPLVVVATQCIEAGVDIDLDALFSELAPLDALRQRFGRLNRDGRPIETRAAIVAVKEETGSRCDDAVYGSTLHVAWRALMAASGETVARSSHTRNKKADGAYASPAVDFGIEHFVVTMELGALAIKADAPILMPAHVDLLSHTAPIPLVDPEIALYLHGPRRQPDAVTLVWRADIDGLSRDGAARLLTLMPPRSGEAIELPVWTVRRWLSLRAARADSLADVPCHPPEETDWREAQAVRRVFRWRGPGEQSDWISGNRVQAGDTIVAPADYGGVDPYGWNAASRVKATDVADEAAVHLHRSYLAVRVSPSLLDSCDDARQALPATLAALQAERVPAILEGVLGLPLPEPLAARLRLLRQQRGLHAHFDVYGVNDDEAPRGVVFVAPHGVKEQSLRSAHRAAPRISTEDDLSGSTPGFAQSLREHSAEVESMAERFARAAGLSDERVADVKVAGWLHDQGKRDARFQRWMHHGDPLGADPDDESTIWAKSDRALPPAARDKAGLPERWRHEALSVRLARGDARLLEAADADLVLWLVGTHHGQGRPLFPHADPSEPASDPGPQSLAFEWNGEDWPTLFNKLKQRYGVWELARWEAILRLADHRASEAAALTRSPA